MAVMPFPSSDGKDVYVTPSSPIYFAPIDKGHYPQQDGAYPPQGGAKPSQGGAYPQQGGAKPPQGGANPQHPVGHPPPPYYPQAISQTGNTVVVMQPRRTVSVTSTVDAPVDDYGYTVSIVLCFICLFCGSWCSLCCIVPAIYFASSAKSAASRGHLESARHSGRIANGLNTASVVSYVIIFAVSIGLSLAHFCILLIANVIITFLTKWLIVNDAHTVIVTKHEMSGEECSACPFQPTVTILPV
eukprot:Em0003g1744a